MNYIVELRTFPKLTLLDTMPFKSEKKARKRQLKEYNRALKSLAKSDKLNIRLCENYFIIDNSIYGFVIGIKKRKVGV